MNILHAQAARYLSDRDQDHLWLWGWRSAVSAYRGALYLGFAIGAPAEIDRPHAPLWRAPEDYKVVR
jgi:hypothetical protein